MTLSYDDFLKAQRDTADMLQVTPFVESEKLSSLIEGKVYLKYEHAQVTHSFKARGAYTKLLSLSDADKAQGIVVVSGGNYAKAIAYFAHKMNIPVHIVLPTSTEPIKIESCKEYGANIELKGNTLDEAIQSAGPIAQKHRKVLLSPYEGDEDIYGYGVIGIEMIEQQRPPLDAVIVPIGTGRLATGIGRVLNVRWPLCAVYGVQTLASSQIAEKIFMYRTSRERPHTTYAKEVFVNNPPSKIVKNLGEVLSDIFVVTERMIQKSVEHCLRYERQIVEYSGALGIAALFQNTYAFSGKHVGIILCGGNTDFLENIEFPDIDDIPYKHRKLTRE